MSYEIVTEYIEGLYKNNELTNRQYTDATELRSFGHIIDDSVARMLQVLILSKKPQKVLEIGTSIGFSTTIMAQVMKQYGGKIVTIEIDKKIAAQAMKNFKREGVAGQIELKIGDARKIVAGMGSEFDLIFQDVGDKKLYAEMFDDYLRLLKDNGLLVAEDMLFPVFESCFDDDGLIEMCQPIDIFNKKVATNCCFVSTILPLGDGLTVAVKKFT